MLKIKRERLRRGWNQTTLAYRAKLSVADVSRIETGRTQPYPPQAARLAKALRLPAAELLLDDAAEALAGTDAGARHDVEAGAA